MLPTLAGNNRSIASCLSSGVHNIFSAAVWWSRGSSEDTNQRVRFSDSRRLALVLEERRGPGDDAAELASVSSGGISALWDLPGMTNRGKSEEVSSYPMFTIKADKRFLMGNHVMRIKASLQCCEMVNLLPVAERALLV